jgi:hypothetical protein
MVYTSSGYCSFALCSLWSFLKNVVFQKLELFLSSDGGVRDNCYVGPVRTS